MLGGKQSTIVVAIAAAGMGAFIAMWLLDFAAVRAGWCAANEAESSAQCAREWISALSGWVAAVTAGATVVVVVWQVQGAASQHSENMQFIDAPNRNIMKRAVNRIQAAVLEINPMARAVPDKSDIEDPFMFGGEDFLQMFEQADQYLDKATFEAAGNLDEGLVGISYQKAKDALRQAIAAAHRALQRAAEDAFHESEEEARSDRTVFFNAIQTVFDLHSAVFAAARSRYPGDYS